MTYLILAILAGIAAFGVITYNGLIRLKNKTDEAWSDIDTQLKRRYDLLPNLVETVKGYATHESGTLENVIKARTAAMGAQSVADKENAENMLTGALKSIFALSENYPDLKANQSFLSLQKTLKEIEEHIQLSRRYYNANVRDFNTKIQVFPNNLIAKNLGFKEREFFQATDSEKENVKVSFKKDEPKKETPAPTAEAPKAEEPKPTETPTQTKAEAPKEGEAKPTEAPVKEEAKTPETPSEETPAPPTNDEQK